MMDTASDGPPADAIPLGRWSLLAPAAAIVLLGVIIIPWLPAGVCFDDSGDLQTACLKLGVAHDPGYAGYVSLGWLIAQLPLRNPAYGVTLACCLSGLAALALCAALQVRLGAHPLAAAGVVLLCALHPAVRDNLVVPEVYAPTAALLLAALVSMHAYSPKRRASRLWLTAALLGIAAASRPSVILTLPGFLLGFWLAERRGRRGDAPVAPNEARPGQRRGGRPIRTLAIAAVCFAAPGVYTVAHLATRAPPSDADAVFMDTVAGRAAPADPGSLQHRATRVWRCLTGANYAMRWSRSWRELGERALWASVGCMPAEGRWWLIAIVPLAALGAVRTARRNAVLAWSLAGVFGGAAAMLALVHTVGTAADYMSLVLITGACCGVGLSGGEPTRLRGRLLAIRHFAFAACAVAALSGFLKRPVLAEEQDAEGFLRALDLTTLPRDTVVIASWFEATALRYTRAASGRDDVHVIPPDDAATRVILEHEAAQTPAAAPLIVVVGPVDVPAGLRLEPYRNVRRATAAGP